MGFFLICFFRWVDTVLVISCNNEPLDSHCQAKQLPLLDQLMKLEAEQEDTAGNWRLVQKDPQFISR